MGLLTYMITAVVNVILIAIDIAVVLIIVHLLNHRRPNKILAISDSSAKPLVGALTDTADRLWKATRSDRQLSIKGKLLLVVLLLTAARLLIVQTYSLIR